MRDSIRCTIGSPWNLLRHLPSIIYRSISDSRFRINHEFIRFGLAITSISKFMPDPVNRIIIERDIMIPMRDGVRLCADVLRPLGGQRYPALIIRHPYGRYLFDAPARQFAKQGFAVVHADERGRFGSEGDWYIFRTNESDGRDICEWIVRQPWSNGKIGGWGSSMLGINQWMLAPDNPLVTAIAPNMGCMDVRRFLHFGGARPLSALALLGNWVGLRKNSSMVDLYLWLKSSYEALPVTEIIHQSIGRLDWIEDLISHDTFDTFFDYLSCDGKYETITAPSFSITGWYDMFCDSIIHDFQQIQASQTDAGRKSRLLIGPWGHYWALDMKLMDEYVRYSGLETLKWYKYIFEGEKNGVEDWPPVKYYEMGADKWRESNKWPPPGTTNLRLYLAGNDRAGGLSKERNLLKSSPPNSEPPDTFVYDPADPIPTIGGDHLFFNHGMKDQAQLTKRQDVLIYQTNPLDDLLEIAGPIMVNLHVSTDAPDTPDTDFTAKLVDVCPDGRIWNLRDGIIRMKYHNCHLSPSKETSLEPGKIYEISVNLGHISYLFKRGHRVGLHVSSSNFPKFDRNLNTGEEPITAKTMRPAHQKIFHDREHPSFLELAVPSRKVL